MTPVHPADRPQPAHAAVAAAPADDDPAALVRRLDDLRSALRAFADLCFVVGPDGVVEDFHAGAPSLLYVPPERFMGRPLVDLVPQDVRALLADGLARVRAGESPVTFEYTLTVPSGPRWFEGRVVPHAGGRALLAIRDVTARRLAADALAASERRFRDLFEQSPISMFTLDADLRLLRANRAWSEMWGVGTEDVRGVDANADEQLRANGLLDLCRQALAGRTVQVPVTAYRPAAGRRAGETIVFRAVIAPVRDAAGNVVELLVMEEDVTAAVRAAEALRASEERFRRLFEQTAVSMFCVGPDLRIRDVNRAFEALWGMPASAAVGFDIRADPQLRDAGIIACYERALAGETVQFPPTAYTPSTGPAAGRPVWISGVICPVRSDAGEVVEILVVQEDVTARVAAEQALAASETRFRDLIDQSPLCVHTFAPDGTTRSVNRAFEAFWGLGPADVTGYNVLRCPRVAAAGVAPLIARAFAGEALVLPPARYGIERGPFAGQERYIAPVFYPVRGPDGAVREVVCMYADTSEQHRAEAALRESERHHRAAADLAGRLLRELDHRVRNNLAGLLGLVAAARRSEADAPSFIAAVERRIRGMLRVHELLATSAFAAVPLRTLVASLLASLGESAPAPLGSASADGPDADLTATQALALNMILAEWFANSAKHGALSSPEGRATIAWEVVGDGPGRRLRLAWRETGGPPVTAPARSSLGTDLVRSFARLELHGEVHLSYPPEGASHQLEFPLVADAGEEKLEDRG